MTSTAKRKPRFLPALIGLLLCSNLVTALVAYLVIDRMDERYSSEMKTAVPGLHEVMMLAQESTNTHRAAGNLLMARDPAEEKVIWERLQEARRQERARLIEVFPGGPVGPNEPLGPLWEASRAYEASLEKFIAIFSQGDKQAALAYRLDKLREDFDLYQTRQREESIRRNLSAMRKSEEISAQAKAKKSLLLGFGGWPLAVMLALLLGFGVLGAVLWRQLLSIEEDEKRLRAESGF